jgi:hypothetical protein
MRQAMKTALCVSSSVPTMVVAVYRLHPNRRAQWLETWQHLASVAKPNPACRSFILALDPVDSNQCGVVSVWSSGAAFDCFVRDVGLTWIERSLNYSEMPPRYARYFLPQAKAAKLSDTPRN